MRISIHLVARLLKVPILRIDGVISLHDDESYPNPVPAKPAVPIGRLLASAEADLDRLTGAATAHGQPSRGLWGSPCPHRPRPSSHPSERCAGGSP